MCAWLCIRYAFNYNGEREAAQKNRQIYRLTSGFSHFTIF